MSSRSGRLEWISLLYLAFFVLAVISPSLYTHGYFGLSQTRLEELTIFAFGLAGLLTFTFYERLMERRDKEREHAEVGYQKAKNELIESYAYIGSINRKIEMLKKVSNDTSLSVVGEQKIPKELFQALVANACAAIGAQSALLRFVELEKLRTEREFGHAMEGKPVFRIPNKDLRALHEGGEPHGFVRSEDAKEILVIPSDRRGPLKAYLLFALDSKEISEIDTSLLKVFANQAEMLYQSFSRTEKMKLPAPELVEAGQ